MAWYDSPRKRKRYHKNRMNDLEQINIKYTREFQRIGLGGVLNHRTIYGDYTGGVFLSYKEKDEPAWEYAKKKADASMTWYQGLISGNVGQIFVNFIIATALIVVNVVTAGATTPITIAAFAAGVVAATTALVANLAGHFYGMKATGKAGLAQSKAGAVAAYKNKELAEQQSNALTHLIVYGGYEIYANGAIYKQGQSGTESFCFDKAFDGTKGLRGDLSRDELTEQIHSRIGANAAGGVNFHSNLLEVDFPLKSFDLSKDALQDALINRYRLAMDILAAAFVELNNLDFNANGRAQEVYNQKLELYTRPTKKTIYQNDFLDKLKNYNKDLRADFNFADDKMFRSRKQNSKDIKGALGAIDSLDDLMNDEELSDEFKANYYIDLVVSLLDLLQDFADETIYAIGDLILTSYMPNFEYDYTLRENENGNFYKDIGGFSLKNFNILKGYYTENKVFNGDEILQIYKDFLTHFKGRNFIIKETKWVRYYKEYFGNYQFLFIPAFDGGSNWSNNYNSGATTPYSTWGIVINNNEILSVLKTELKMPEQLKFFDFSTIKKEIKNNFDESDYLPRDDED